MLEICWEAKRAYEKVWFHIDLDTLGIYFSQIRSCSENSAESSALVGKTSLVALPKRAWGKMLT